MKHSNLWFWGRTTTHTGDNKTEWKPANGKQANMDKVVNPHDKLFRETWSDKEHARSFLDHYLPDAVRVLVDLESLEISKDSFVGEDLRDYHSDILYSVNLKKTPGYIYLLFEHKSYKDGNIHLQMLEYMLKIWRRVHHEKTLPAVIPLVIYHGRSY